MKKVLLISIIFLFTACDFLKGEDDSTNNQAVPNPSNYSADVHYAKVTDSDIMASNPSKVIVHKFFKYICGHCMEMTPLIDDLIQSKYQAEVEYVKVPVSGDGVKLLHAKLFFLKHKANTSDNLDSLLFTLTDMHKKEGYEIEQQKESYKGFFSRYGITGEQFDTFLMSQEVQDSLDVAANTMKALDVTGTPTIVVGGKYRINTDYFNDDHDIMPLVEYLIEVVQSE